MDPMWCWPHPFGQPLISDIARRHEVDQIGLRAEVLGEHTAKAARLRHRQPARLGAGAADDVAERQRVGRVQPRGSEPLVERLDRFGLDPPEEDVLLDRQPHGPVAVRLGEIREDAHLTCGEVAERQTHGHVTIPGLALPAHIVPHPAEI